MHYDEWSQTVKIFTMIALRTHRDDETRCNDHLQISETMRYHGKHLDALDCTAFSFQYEETEQSCGARRVFFYFSNTGRLPIVACREKDFLGERELCDIL